MRTKAIVVGTDGTPSSAAAVDWAAHEAQRRRLPLRIMHAYEWDGHEARYGVGNEYADIVRYTAEAVAAAAYRQARVLAPDIEIHSDTTIGHPARRLVEVAEDTALMVLGSRGRGGFAGLLLGSVSQGVATHAACPVLVVRGGSTAPDGPVVVGVDDSEAADHVLEAAFDAATGRGTGLLAIRAYLPAIPRRSAGSVSAAQLDTPEQDDAERARLEERLAPWRAKYPDVSVGVELPHGSPAGALVAAARTAQLVVVGSHGHGMLAGTLLGSVALRLLHHAACPVYLVRHS